MNGPATRDRPTSAFGAPVVAIVLLLLILLLPAYFAAYYFSLSTRRMVLGIAPDGQSATVGPEYHWGGSVASWIFIPAHGLDRRLRPNHWEIRVERIE
jgi:hypothetical protein